MLGIAALLAIGGSRSLATPNASGLSQLLSAYPGLAYSEASPTDWRIWGRSFGGGSSPKQTAQAFVNQYAGPLFSINVADVHFDGQQDVMNGKFTVVYFRQYVDTVPVLNGYLACLIKNDIDNQMVLVVGAMSGTDPSGLPGGFVLSGNGAANAAARVVRKDVSIESVEPILFTRGETPRMAYQVRVVSRNPRLRYHHLLFIDATTGDKLDDVNLILQADIGGTVMGNATPGMRPDILGNAPTLQPVPGARVFDYDGNYTFTNPDGTFVLPHLGTVEADVTATVDQGLWVSVDNTDNIDESRTVTVTPPGPADFTLNPGKKAAQTAQVNAMIHVTKVHDFVKSIEPNFPGIDYPIVAKVNNPYSSQLGDFDFIELNFAPADFIQGWVNGAYSSVIYHEYGHYIVSRAQPNFPILLNSFHEGFADLLSALFANDPEIFREANGPGSLPLRNLETTTEQYPSGEATESHTAGQVIAGAFWHTKDQLAATIGDTAALDVVRRLYLGALLVRPYQISPMMTIDVLTLDDDDGDLSNGTPHWNEIKAGFGQHNLRAPNLPLVRFEVNIPAGFTTPNTIHTATALISPGINHPDMDTVMLHLSVNGGPYSDIPLGSINPVLATFPAQPCGTIVRWYLSVDTLEGVMAYYPADGRFSPEVVIYSVDTRVIFYDDCETDKGWQVQNISVSTGGWIRGIPNYSYFGPGDLARPFSDSPYDSGNKCWMTGLGVSGGGARYGDLDGGPTILTSPTFDLNGYNGQVSFESWLYNNGDDDHLFLDISNDGGQTWVPVHTFVPGDYLPQGPIVGRVWISYDFIVSDIVQPTANMKLRFTISDNPNNSVTIAGVDQIQITRFMCNSGTNVLFSGRLDLETYVGDPTLVSVDVEFRDPVSGSVIASSTVHPDAQSNIVVSVAPGTYTVAVKADRWLRVIVPSVTVDGTGVTDIDLPDCGDADSNNHINLEDLNLIFVQFGETDAGTVDLDGSGSVGLPDMNIVFIHFGLDGPP